MIFIYFKGMVDTQCPFYIKEANKSITCEGMKEECNLCIKFQSEEEKLKYQEENCFKYPNGCEIRKINEEKYKR